MMIRKKQADYFAVRRIFTVSSKTQCGNQKKLFVEVDSLVRIREYVFIEKRLKLQELTRRKYFISKKVMQSK